jgi:hypothetical protein
MHTLPASIDLTRVYAPNRLKLVVEPAGSFPVGLSWSSELDFADSRMHSG